MRIRVIKLGGSLLGWTELNSTLASWHARQKPLRNIWVLGGGTPVDQLRQHQSQRGLSDEQAHWTAIEQMGSNARDFVSYLPGNPEIGGWKALANSGIDFVIDDYSNLPGIRELPRDWSVTSDSVAALVASRFPGLQELVLLKSVSAPACLSECRAESVVDGFFNTASMNIDAIRIVNLRKGLDTRVRP